MSKSMREATFLILAALADQDLHGYGIIGEVKELSGGRLKLGPGHPLWHTRSAQRSGLDRAQGDRGR